VFDQKLHECPDVRLEHLRSLLAATLLEAPMCQSEDAEFDAMRDL